jgi:hypothetical protein
MYQGTEGIIAKTKDRTGTGEKKRVRVWPDLVLRETIAALAAIIFLLGVSILFDAPLETIADPSFSMNPSKAPWYFLGLQELLVYFTPWVAGVTIPVLVIVGLMAVPYIDTGRRQAGGRLVFIHEKRIRTLFSAGMCLWIVLTVIGFYFRGPNWAWQWPGGKPVESGHSLNSMDWLLPLVVFLYFAGILIKWYRHRGDGTGNDNIIKHFFSHILMITGLAVTIKIAVYNILDLILK